MAWHPAWWWVVHRKCRSILITPITTLPQTGAWCLERGSLSGHSGHYLHSFASPFISYGSMFTLPLEGLLNLFLPTTSLAWLRTCHLTSGPLPKPWNLLPACSSLFRTPLAGMSGLPKCLSQISFVLRNRNSLYPVEIKKEGI